MSSSFIIFNINKCIKEFWMNEFHVSLSLEKLHSTNRKKEDKP